MLSFMVRALATTPESMATRAEEYDYSSFYLLAGNPNPYSFAIQSVDGSKTEFVSKHVPLRKGDLISIQSMQYGLLLACVGETLITEENPTCEMVSLELGATHYGESMLFGYYDVNIKFSGQTAKLSFIKVEDINVDYSKLNFSIRDGFTTTPYEATDNKIVYKSLPLLGKHNFVFQNSVDGTMYAWKVEQPVVSSDNPTTTIYSNPDYYASFDFQDGHYDITLEYAADHSSANVSFSKSVIPEEIAKYSGDLYMVGEISQGVIGDEKCKFTCLQPGVYEWKGETIDSEFRIMGTDDVIPGTKFRPNFGAPIYDIPPFLTVNSDYLLQINGSGISLPDAMYEIRNPVVTLDLRNLTLKVTGDYAHQNIALKDLTLITSDYISRSPDSVDENSAKFQEVDFTDINGFVVNYRDKISFAYNTQEGPIVNKDNLEVTLNACNPREAYFVTTTLSDKYDVIVTLNEAQTAATVKFMKYVPTSISEVADDSQEYNIIGYSNGVYISNTPQGTEISIYTIDGRNTGNYVSTGETMNIDLPQRGLYIVRIGASAFKINI